MVSEFISANEKFSGLNLLLIVTMLGWSVKTSSERFKTDSGIKLINIGGLNSGKILVLA